MTSCGICGALITVSRFVLSGAICFAAFQMMFLRRTLADIASTLVEQPVEFYTSVAQWLQ